MMGKKSLTVVSAKAAKQPGMVPDGTVPGLYLRVAPGGSKSWILRTVIQGRRRDIGLGGFSTTSLAKARLRARELREVARDGGNPLQGRQSKTQLTFRAAAERFYREQVLASTSNGKHQDQWINTLGRYVFPKIGELEVGAVDKAEVLDVLSSIWAEKPETARRIRQRMSAVFSWARQAGFRESQNPVDDVSSALPRHKKQIKHFSAMPWREVPAFWAELQRDQSVSARALSLLILTAARTGEVMAADWSEFDLENHIWTVPATRMKAGREHRKPLGEVSVELVRTMQQSDSGYVFTGAKPRMHLSNMAMLALLKRTKHSAYTVHGFRTSFRVWAAEKGEVSREIAEMCLAHDIRDNVEQAYARTDYFEQRKALMQRWEEWCARAG